MRIFGFLGVVALPCPICGRAIVQTNRGRPRKYCSPACQMRRHRPNWSPDGMKPCQQCGRAFRVAASGDRYCSDECRSLRAMRSVSLACVSCGERFVARPYPGRRGSTAPGGIRKTCSERCAQERARVAPRRPVEQWRAKARACSTCGRPMQRLGGARRCAACAGDNLRAYWRQKNATRRGATALGRRMTIRDLGERDGWRCHLCGKSVSPKFRAPHRMSPTFDHLMPVSAGGTDAPENLALAHFGCNSRRQAAGEVQLLLFG